MTSTKKNEEKYGYWSDTASANRGYHIYNSTEGKGPIEVTSVSDKPPDKILKGTNWKDLKYVGKVTKHLKYAGKVTGDLKPKPYLNPDTGACAYMYIPATVMDEDKEQPAMFDSSRNIRLPLPN